VTAFYAVLDPARRTLTYARAGHNPPRLVRRGQIRSLEETGALPLGILENQAYGQATVPVEPGDLVLFYTDGITEASPPPRNGTRDLFGVERLDALLVDCGPSKAADCIERVRNDVAAFCNNAPPIDDQTLIAIRCL
jgi:sigma-B regulation protein RsbU (phosphoserine phosphatase)